MNWTHHRFVALLLAGVIMAAASLAGCGHKGPLFLPDESKAEQAKEKKS